MGTLSSVSCGRPACALDWWLDSVVHYRVHTWRMDSTSLSIGEVAKEAGVGVETVRFYEREGLVPEPGRRPSGYRQYPPDTVRRIRFVQRAKELGFTLREIRELLSLRVAERFLADDKPGTVQVFTIRSCASWNRSRL